MKQLIVLLAVSLFVFTGCKEEKKATATKATAVKPATAKATTNKKELKIGITQEFENMNVMLANMLATSYLYKAIGRNLVTMDTDGKWIPQVVEKMPTMENGLAKFETHNGKETIVANWRIRDDQYWGDGTPVTAADVEFAIQNVSEAVTRLRNLSSMH